MLDYFSFEYEKFKLNKINNKRQTAKISNAALKTKY